MVAHAALAIIAALALVGSATAVAADTGAFSSAGTGNMDLGTLSPGENGTATATASVTNNNSTYYHLQSDMQDRIGSVFSVFQISVSVDGHMYTMQHGENGMFIHLPNGTSKVTVKLHYQVRKEVHSANGSRIAFLYLHAADNVDAGHEVMNGPANSTISAASASSSTLVPQDVDNNGNDAQNNSQRIVLATLTFHLNGNAGKSTGEDSQNQKEAKDQIMPA